jgi:hypothetical protein
LDGSERCDRCGSGDETTTLYRDGHVWACFCIECHDETAEFAHSTPDGSGQTPQEEWEEHNKPFDYRPPQKPPDAWSSDEYQQLHDRVISRRTQWFCDKCSGRGPFRSLQRARRHVQSQHSPDLVERYAPDEEELKTATDGGTSEDRAAKRAEENHGLGDFSGGESA